MPNAQSTSKQLFQRLSKRLAGVSTLDTANQFLDSICGGTIIGLRCSQRRPPICIGHAPHVGIWIVSCVSRRPGVCRRTSPSRIRGHSIGSARPSGLHMCWWKSAWMGQCRSRTTASPSTITSSPVAPQRPQRSSLSITSGGQSQRGLIIRGAYASGRSEPHRSRQCGNKSDISKVG